MKNKLALSVAALFLAQSVSVWAAPETTNFQVSATVPLATSVGITVSKIPTGGGTATVMPAGTTDLSFNPLTYNTQNNIYIPGHYFALDFAAAGGAGRPDVTVKYTEGTNPNGATNGLGYKATATFVKKVGNNETVISSHGKKLLKDLTNERITPAEITGGTPRVYLGVWTGSTDAPADPVAGQPFSNADAAGAYSGTLVVTTTVS